MNKIVKLLYIIGSHPNKNNISDWLKFWAGRGPFQFQRTRAVTDCIDFIQKYKI